MARHSTLVRRQALEQASTLTPGKPTHAGHAGPNLVYQGMDTGCGEGLDDLRLIKGRYVKDTSVGTEDKAATQNGVHIQKVEANAHTNDTQVKTSGGDTRELGGNIEVTEEDKATDKSGGVGKGEVPGKSGVNVRRVEMESEEIILDYDHGDEELKDGEMLVEEHMMAKESEEEWQ
ncbi:hypothetical protein NDU88_003801 [Pleurodeles waltl]|uniref:Uncharacterized protein n=1 Tax=Pleurodeles waltl TaxID=8319 RepID=A0AAV7PC76_PLEWA|nr:hypothetical protein NDU88_003801 [Pleurodeles waltl]